jgi:CRISPR/Cas system CMR subunit Cmr6 (Cas7 group RAMP superfamily)
MTYDFYFDHMRERDLRIDFDRIDQIKDIYYKTKLYSIAFAEDSSRTRALDKYKEDLLDYSVPKITLDLMENVSVKDFHYNPKVLLRSSFFLHVRFILQKPFISKDDEGFYIHDNPVSKEKVFKVPYIRASSWKGGLRWAFGRANGLPEDDERILRVFGNKKKEETTEDLRKGRLYTYPTFFDKISLDIINPHDRIARAGKIPITLEVVPRERKGDLHLLYVSFDRIGVGSKETREETEVDLLFLCRAIRALLTEYGMSAKRTSGYGAAQIEKITFRSTLLREYEKYTDLKELIDALNGRYPLNTSREVGLNE